MFLMIIVISFFVLLILIVDKNKNNSQNTVPKRKKVVNVLSLDQKIKLEKIDGIQQVSSTLVQLKKQKINQLIVALNNLKESK